jgi:dihydroorotase
VHLALIPSALLHRTDRPLRGRFALAPALRVYPRPSADISSRRTIIRRVIRISRITTALAAAWLTAATPAAQLPQYDLLIRGGHVIDARNGVDAPRDIAIRGDAIAAVAARLDPAQARRVVDATGLLVAPGLIDIHTHVYAGTGEPRSYAGDNSVYPDGFSFRTGVTTVVDAGGAGWRNIDDFRQRVIARSRTRVLAMLNIVGHGMRGGAFEQDVGDMDAAATAEAARRHAEVVVGIKTAHFGGPAWTPVERAVEAGASANVPVMVDFGRHFPERPLEDLLLRKLRPGDIYTHLYSGLRGELVDGVPNPALGAARTRGVVFDVGHGAGSFRWSVAVPIVGAGFLPDSISTDLHTSSMNAGMKDQLNVMSKFLALGVPVARVVAMATWHPARQIKRETLGHLSVGAPADIAVLRLERGQFGFVDMDGRRRSGTERLTCELTVKGGVVVYDLNGLAATEWR